MQFQSLLFDLDGTLLDTAPDLVAAANMLYRNHHKPVYTYEQLRPLASDGSLAFIELGFGSKVQEQSALRNEYVKLYLKHFGENTQLFPGVKALLEYFTALDFPWGIVTNKPRHLTNITLERFPVLAKAKSVISGDTINKSKPHPAPVLLACKEMGILPENAAFIGDHERDIIAGRDAGLYTIVARYGYISNPLDIPRWLADAEIEDINDIYPLIAS